MNHVSRYLLKEFLPLFAASFGFVTFLLSLVNIFQAVELLVANMLGIGTIFRYWLLLLAYLLPYALGLSSLIAVIITFSRLARDRELTAIRGLGIPLRRAVLPLAGAGLLISLANLGATGFIQPYGRYQARVLRQQARLTPPASLLRPGSISTDFPGTTIFVSTFRGSGSVRIFHKEETRARFISAERAALERKNGHFSLFLENGSIQVYDPEEPDRSQKLVFRSYRFPLPERPGAGSTPRPGIRESSSRALAADGTDPARVEQYTRLSFAFAPLALMLAGISIGASLTRTAWGVIAACGIVLAYHFLISALEFIAQGQPAMVTLILVPNIVIFSVGLWALKN